LRILAVSDFHGNREAFHRVAAKAKKANADILVVCGDIIPFYTASLPNATQLARDLMHPLIKLKLPLLFVPGNCDPPSLPKVGIKGASCIHGCCQVHGDVEFVGVGAVPLDRVHPSPYELLERQISAALNRGFRQCSPKRWLVVVSHTPPRDTKLDVAYGGAHIGSSSVRRFIEEKQPSLVLCGHVHEAQGIDYIGKTMLVNPGPARHGHCATADFNAEIRLKLDHI